MNLGKRAAVADLEEEETPAVADALPRCSAEEPKEDRSPVVYPAALVIALSLAGWALIIAGGRWLIG